MRNTCPNKTPFVRTQFVRTQFVRTQSRNQFGANAPGTYAHDGSTDGTSIPGDRWPRFLLADADLWVFAVGGRARRERDAQQSPEQMDRKAPMYVLGVELHPSAKLWSTSVVYVLEPSSPRRGNAAPLTWEKAGGEQDMLSTCNEYPRI